MYNSDAEHVCNGETTMELGERGKRKENDRTSVI
jgi:hypothetical protein